VCAATRRCGAKTRSGKTCMWPAVSRKSRCRMHGGAAGSGAPRGNKNALKHGRFTREAIAERRLVRSLLQESRALIRTSGRRRPAISRAQSQSFLRCLLRNLTPGPPPFSSMNSTPAASKVLRIAVSLAAVSDVTSPTSARLIVFTPKVQCRTRSAALHFNNARAALICPPVRG
jgi:hypothetical protein